MTLVVGCDPSAKKIAFVATDPVLGVTRVMAYPLYKTGSQTTDSLGKAVVAVQDFLGEIEHMAGGDVAAWVETPVQGGRAGNVASVMKQSYVRGIVVGVMVAAGFRVYDVHQSTWKSWFGVRANKATKDAKTDVKRILSVKHPKIAQLTGDDVDLTDAGAIALYGCEQERKAAALRASGLAGSEVQRKNRRRTVLRPPRVRT